MRTPALVAAAFALAAALGSAARADERRFTYVYEPRVLPEGALELEQWATAREGRQHRDYSAWDLRTELEIGLTDYVATAIYFNYSYVQAEELEEDEAEGEEAEESEDGFKFDGISNEWRWKLSDPVDDLLGTLLYFEWLYQGKEAELEEKIVIGREFGPLALAANLIFEQEWEWEEGETERELEVKIALGASYRVTPRFAVGLEAENRNDFPEYEEWESSVFYAGPNLHFATGRFWATLTVMPQIGASRGATDGHLNLEDHERVEARLIMSVSF